MLFDSTLKPKLIYVFRINDKDHAGCLKIGEATLPDGSDFGGFTPCSHALNQAAKKRIDQYTRTAGISYELLYTEVTLYFGGGTVKSFNDKAVHEVLLRSGIRRRTNAGWGSEWFETDLETVKNAIKAVKEGRKSLSSSEKTEGQNPIIFRPEQKDAIEKTEKQFRRSNQMLWNAKMRFGKTLSALQVVKDMGLSRTLILTHRPVVDDGWYEDFNKIFYDRKDYAYGSRDKGESFASLKARARSEALHYVYFASMQDLRGSEQVGGKFDKNNEIFSTSWDLLIVDEAHEGTQTELGQSVIHELVKDGTKVLSLSGTPFNLFDEYKENEVYTWDYVMEQKAKAEWDLEHFGDPNPYAELPTMNIYTYDLGRLLKEYIDEDVAFNFREFFRVNDSGEFVHHKDVAAFLDLLCRKDTDSAYPFATDEYRNNFRHTLWMIPGVKSALALQRMLERHPVFQHFQVVNVAGEGDPTEEENAEALALLRSKIGDDPDETRTITLSCGRLTTGVTVREWTAVLMLSGSLNTAAAGYMQTIFRVQSPATINGRVKENCYVFDFAPDRTLKVLAETAKISTKAGKTSSDDRTAMAEFLNFCPVIGMEGSRMRKFDVDTMLRQLKKVYIERVVANGFEDGYLYNDELLKLGKVELEEFKELKGIIGSTKAMPHTKSVDINNQGLTNEEYDELEDLEKRNRSKKDKAEMSEEQKRRLEELKKRRKNRENAISILRGISIRMPLMIYGADIEDDEEITIDNFASKIDPQSWEEFMPRGVSKQQFNAFRKYYDPDIFAAAAKRIREMARNADRLSIEQRIERITQIFATFRNPDKETVLTPWRVVNMHMSDTLGGYAFYDEDFKTPLSEPRFVDRGKVTAEVFNPQTHILEINSKTGLYPLYVAYSIYRARLRELLTSPESIEDEWAVWAKAVSENVFVVCKTKMARSITRRTLVGFHPIRVNTYTPDDLINKIKNQPDLFIKKVHDLVGQNVKINAIVGNPPYQVTQANNGDSANRAMAGAIYPKFIELGDKLRPNFLSLITPSRWMSKTGRGISSEWVDKMIKCNHFISIYDYPFAQELFLNVEIKGGVNYFLYSADYSDKCTFYSIREGEKSSTHKFLDNSNVGFIVRDAKSQSIISKVVDDDNESFMDLVGPNTLFCDCAKGILNTNWNGYTLSPESDDAIKYYLNKKTIEVGFAWIKPTDMIKSVDVVPLHKVYIPEAAGTGNDSQILGKPFYGEPNSICSQTYICIGYKPGQLNSKTECDAVMKYIQSKFLRFLVSIKKNTQHSFAQVYQLVPLQDFTDKSDIDWTQSVADIDRQLYRKYDLSDDEIAFIESMIKPM